MPLLHWIGQHRLWALGTGVTVLVVVAAVGVWFLGLHSPGTRLGMDEALHLYRARQAPSAVGGRRSLPPPGVYRYRTTGDEALSIGGISRRFPATTEMIVTDARCASVSWVPFTQHVESFVECPAPGGAMSMVASTSHEDIAGVSTDERITCPTSAYLVPPSSVGSRWTATCRAAGQTVGFGGRVVGTGAIEVDGRSVPAVHIRVTLSFAGSESGTNPTDYWIDIDDGLIVREEEQVAMADRAGPLGSVHYAERMSLTALSLSPRR